MLQPGGTLRFFEHVRSTSRTWAAVQDLATPIWATLADGCHPNRATVGVIEQAGFVIESLERLPLGPYPARPGVSGVARQTVG